MNHRLITSKVRWEGEEKEEKEEEEEEEREEREEGAGINKNANVQ